MIFVFLFMTYFTLYKLLLTYGALKISWKVQILFAEMVCVCFPILYGMCLPVSCCLTVGPLP